MEKLFPPKKTKTEQLRFYGVFCCSQKSIGFGRVGLRQFGPVLRVPKRVIIGTKGVHIKDPIVKLVK